MRDPPSTNSTCRLHKGSPSQKCMPQLRLSVAPLVAPAVWLPLPPAVGRRAEAAVHQRVVFLYRQILDSPRLLVVARVPEPMFALGPRRRRLLTLGLQGSSLDAGSGYRM